MCRLLKCSGTFGPGGDDADTNMQPDTEQEEEPSYTDAAALFLICFSTDDGSIYLSKEKRQFLEFLESLHGFLGLNSDWPISFSV